MTRMFCETPLKSILRQLQSRRNCNIFCNAHAGIPCPCMTHTPISKFRLKFRPPRAELVTCDRNLVLPQDSRVPCDKKGAISAIDGGSRTCTCAAFMTSGVASISLRLRRSQTHFRASSPRCLSCSPIPQLRTEKPQDLFARFCAV